jgi:hypothetical protein
MAFAHCLEREGISRHGPQWSWLDEASRLRSEPAMGGVALPDVDEHVPSGAAVSMATCPSAPKQSTLSPNPPPIAKYAHRRKIAIFREDFAFFRFEFRIRMLLPQSGCP